MANQDLEQPVTSGNTGFDRWVFRLYQYVRRWAGDSSSSIGAMEAFAPRQIPVYPSLIATDSQSVQVSRAFAPRDVPFYSSINGAEAQNVGAIRAFTQRLIQPYQNLTAVDAAPILAGQIFGS